MSFIHLVSLAAIGFMFLQRSKVQIYINRQVWKPTNSIVRILGPSQFICTLINNWLTCRLKSSFLEEEQVFPKDSKYGEDG